MPDDKFAWSSPADIEWQTEGDQKKAKQAQTTRTRHLSEPSRRRDVLLWAFTLPDTVQLVMMMLNLEFEARARCRRAHALQEPTHGVRVCLSRKVCPCCAQISKDVGPYLSSFRCGGCCAFQPQFA